MVIKNKAKFVIMVGMACTILIICIGFISCFIYQQYQLEKGYYTAEDFGIEVIYSSKDKNGNGVDDYTDILLGARKDAQTKPRYASNYYQGGYPPENEGVCTDLIWRAIQNAGYDFKEMVDQDIANNLSSYPRVNGSADPNIDFRRVPNLKVFFERNFSGLTLDPYEIEKWQPGDIVIFETDHIGIISDKRNKDGIAFLIHNGGQPFREEDGLVATHQWRPISGHYRFEMK